MKHLASVLCCLCLVVAFGNVVQCYFNAQQLKLNDELIARIKRLEAERTDFGPVPHRLEIVPWGAIQNQWGDTKADWPGVGSCYLFSESKVGR